jgi:GINS complex subunit 4
MADFTNLMGDVDKDEHDDQDQMHDTNQQETTYGDGGGDDDDDDGEGAADSAKEELYRSLNEAWCNEVSSPALLPTPSSSILPQVQALLTNQQQLISSLTSKVKTPTDSVHLNILQIEFDRVRYVVTDLLRTRIKKIERHATHYLRTYAQQHTTDKYLSAQEFKFLQAYVDLIAQHLQTDVLELMPKEWTVLRKLDDDGMVDLPDYDAFVFGRRVREKDRTTKGEDSDEEDDEDDEEFLTVGIGEMCIWRYGKIEEKIESGEYALVG